MLSKLLRENLHEKCGKTIFRVHIKPCTALLLAVLLLFPSMAALAAPIENAPEAIYWGDRAAATVLRSINYEDVKNSNTWAKEAIYEASALGILKGFGNGRFGRTEALTKEEAIALAYRVCGREAEAQQAAEELDNARLVIDKKTDAVSMWSDGYLMLAAEDGLISQEDFNGAVFGIQDGTEPPAFNRRALAQRQEMAFWLAKTLNLEPVYGDQELFTGFKDWRNASPVYIPYIEAILKKGIMNGDNNGNFNPTQPITREQAAQVVKNAEAFILPLLQFEKNTGTVINVTVTGNLEEGVDFIERVFDIMDDNGRVYRIIAQRMYNMSNPYKNEQVGNPIPIEERELVVYRNGNLGNSSLLSVGDRIEYVVSADSIVKYVRATSGDIESRDWVVVSGIVEENNPQLGYITLYNEGENAGAGGSWGRMNGGLGLQTYNYANPNAIEVYKNYSRASIDEVEEGDTAFLRIDKDNNILSISAVDNYTVKYAKVLSKSPSNLLVEYDDGIQQVLGIDDNILVVEGRRIVGLDSLRDGDRVRLTLNETEKLIRIKEIKIEGDEHAVTNIYKGIVSYIDSISNTLVASNLEVFYRGRWMKTEQKGFMSIKLAPEYAIYAGSTKLKPDIANKYMENTEAYIAVENDYDGSEQAVFISFRNEEDTEVIYDDRIVSSSPIAGSFSLDKAYADIEYGPGSIVIKEGRLVSGGSIRDEDMAYIVANREYRSGEYHAGVVLIEERPDPGFIQIYRGRIKEINEGSDFTVESFSQLKGTDWEYSRTPKTFKINNSTRIIDVDGVIGQRHFTDYGENSFIGRTVYILSYDINTVLISTAPYGTCNIRGEIYGFDDADAGSDENELSSVILRKVKIYDRTASIWQNAGDTTLTMLKNTIILKDNRVAGFSDLKKGDRVRVVKREASDDNEAYIIIVEN